MALKLSTEGASTTLKFLSDSLVFEQPNAVNKFKFKRGKLIFAPKTIYSDNLIIEAESIIPVANCYLKGNGSINISLIEELNTPSGLTSSSVRYNQHIAKIIKAIQQTEVSIAGIYWSASRTNSSDSTTLTREQNACLNGESFNSSWYNLNNKAPTLIKTFNNTTTSSDITITHANKIIKIVQNSSKNTYYSIGVKLSWVI